MNLVLFRREEVSGNQAATITDPRRITHIREVIKAKPGDSIKAGLTNGMTGTANIATLEPDRMFFSLDLNNPPPAPSPITLLMALPRPKTFKKVLQAATAFGIKRMIFFNTWKVDKSYWDSPALQVDEILPQLELGLEQAGDTVLPTVEFFRLFKPFAEDILPELARNHDTALVAHPAATAPCPRQVTGPMLLCLGPEGGFTNYEVEMLGKSGLQPVSMGERILRTEFALCALVGRLYQ